MSVPNVNCFLRYYDNAENLSKNPIKQTKYGEARKFYSCKKNFDYLTYVNTGTQRKIDYVEYSGDSEKSSGVFGENGLMTPKERQALRRKLRETKSVIWDCVLTFQPEFGARYCNEYEQAYNLMRKEFPRFLKHAGLKPDNIKWYAGLHTNKRHRHIHISFFENEPTRYRERANGKKLEYSLGTLNKASITRFKLRAELALTDVSAELKIARKDITTLTRDVLFSKESKLKYNSEFHSQMMWLIEKLPAEGRLSYDSKNMRTLKPVIRQLVDIAIKSNPPWYKAFVKFCGEVKKRDDEIREMLIRNHISETNWARYLNADTYLNDMYRRMGNQVLNYARVYKKKEKMARGRLANKRIRQKTADSVLMRAAEMQAALEVDSMYFFRVYLRKLEEAREEILMEELSEME